MVRLSSQFFSFPALQYSFEFLCGFLLPWPSIRKLQPGLNRRRPPYITLGARIEIDNILALLKKVNVGESTARAHFQYAAYCVEVVHVKGKWLDSGKHTIVACRSKPCRDTPNMISVLRPFLGIDFFQGSLRRNAPHTISVLRLQQPLPNLLRTERGFPKDIGPFRFFRVTPQKQKEPRRISQADRIARLLQNEFVY